MSKGTKFIQQLAYTLQKDEERKTQSQQQEESKNNSQSLVPLQTSKMKQLHVNKKEKNFFKRMLKLSPTLESKNVFKLFGFQGINQNAIQNQDVQQSLNHSFFAFRVVEKVEIYNSAIVISLTQPSIPQYQPPLEYIIEKFKSKGDAKYYQLSCGLQQISQIFKQFQKKPPVQQKTDSITKFFDSMGDQMYVAVLSSRKFGISKALLIYLEYDVNEFVIEAIKYRAIFSQFFSAMNYDNMLKHFINCFRYIAKLSRSEISFPEFQQKTTFTYDGFIQSKNHVRSYCNMTNYFVNPATGCHRINFIYYKQGEQNIKKQGDPQIILAIQQEKQRIRQAQYTTINRIKAVPKHLMKHNQKLFASYKDLRQEDQGKEKEIRDK